MKSKKSHFRFSKQERSGVFYLLLLLTFVIAVRWIWTVYADTTTASSLIVNKELQQELDSLRNAAKLGDTLKLYPFNPNYITDYKAYVLGLSDRELDNVLKFRATGAFMNSAEDFRKVSGISDSLLSRSLPYLKFPQWQSNNKHLRSHKDVSKGAVLTKPIIDVNLATKEDLMQINGIGEKLATRTIKFRDRLGGFVSEEQFKDVYGLPPEVAAKAMQSFKVLEEPNIVRININTASYEELANLIYIGKKTAWAILQYRDKNGPFKDFKELKNVHGFPSEKLDRIALYLLL